MISSDYINVIIKPMYNHGESDILDIPIVNPFYLTNINVGHDTDTQLVYRQHTVWTDAVQAFCSHDSESGCYSSLTLTGS